MIESTRDANRVRTQYPTARPSRSSCVSAAALAFLAACGDDGLLGVDGKAPEVPRPVLEEILPAEMCLAGGEHAFLVRGSGFREVAGTPPALVFDDHAGDVHTILPDDTDLQGCSTSSSGDDTERVCTGFTATHVADPSKLERVMYQVHVVNPPAAGSGASNALVVTNYPPPTITTPSAEAPAVISRQGGTVIVEGAGFRAGAVASIGGIAALSTTPSHCDAHGLCSVLTADFAAFGEDFIVGQPLTLEVANVDGCVASQPAIVGCPAPESVATSIESAFGSGTTLRMPSGTIATFVLPSPILNHATGKFLMSAGTSTWPVAPYHVEVHINRCKGLVQEIAGDTCYDKFSTKTGTWSKVWFPDVLPDNPSYDTVEEIEEKGHCHAPAAAGPWYVNIRYTYAGCDLGDTCGWNFQWNNWTY